MSVYHIIDVSKWQGVIDWERVKAAGIDGAMLRAGYGDGNIDEQFVRNAAACNRLGIPIGVYWFSYAWTNEMARREAAHCLAAVAGLRVQLPIAFDWEYDSMDRAKQNGVTPGKAEIIGCAEAFLSAIDEAGYYAANYTNLDYLTRYFDGDRLKQYDVWLAAYRDTRPVARHNMWQYTSEGRIDGIAGNVDFNRAYVHYPSLIAAAGKNHLEGELDMTKEELVSVTGTGDHPSAWAREATAWAKENGILNGDGNGNYGWDRPITREALVTVLHNFAQYLNR